MTERPDSARDEALAAALEDFHRRKSLGEAPRVEDYDEQLSGSQEEFREILRVEAELDGAMLAPPIEPLPRTFDGYTLTEELGRGASGVVYKAVDRKLGRVVALKILRTGFDTDPSARERFRREAKACAHVRHDSIVPIFEAGEVESRPFYAMDLVPGENLAALIRARRAPDPKTLCRGLAGIAAGLDLLHHAGIVHRDVKPSNIVVRADGRMVLTDFGLARSADALSLTQTGDALGTPLYMSPEQMLGQRDEVDQRTDVYGLGATLYEALCGQPPFLTDEVAALMKMILTQRPESIRALAPHVPLECEGIALKALEKRKEDRYATAIAMSGDLLAFAEGRLGDIHGRPVPAPVRVLRGVRRRWIPIAASLAVLLGGLLWAENRPATLRLANGFVPPEGVTVSIDGGAPLPVPFETTVKPGRHVLTLRHPYCVERSEPRMLEAGSKFETRAEMRVDYEILKRDASARKIVNAWLGIEDASSVLPPDPSGSRTRSADDEPPVEMLIPRGDVRPDDLGIFAIRVVASAGAGTLEFRRGDELLHTQFFSPDDVQSWLPMPKEVRAKVKVGDVVVWTWIPQEPQTFPDHPLRDVKKVSAQFRVVTPDAKLTAEIGALEAMLAEQPEGLLRYARGRKFAKNGFLTAAFQDLDAVAEQNPTDFPAWRSLLSLLAEWKLTDTHAFSDIEAWVPRGSEEPPKGAPPTLRPVRARVQK